MLSRDTGKEHGNPKRQDPEPQHLQSQEFARVPPVPQGCVLQSSTICPMAKRMAPRTLQLILTIPA